MTIQSPVGRSKQNPTFMVGFLFDELNSGLEAPRYEDACVRSGAGPETRLSLKRRRASPVGRKNRTLDPECGFDVLCKIKAQFVFILNGRLLPSHGFHSVSSLPWVTRLTPSPKSRALSLTSLPLW